MLDLPNQRTSAQTRQPTSDLGRETGASAPKRFLIVSDSLGTPIHPRGIFHYTTNLIRALRRCGHEVTLLVEQTDSHALSSRESVELGAISELAQRNSRLGAIYNYLFDTDLIGTGSAKRGLRRSLLKRLKWPLETFPLISWQGARLLLHVPTTLSPEIVRNDTQYIDFVPSRVTHLRPVSEFATGKSVYSIAFATSLVNAGALTLDARGFDVIIVDTPTHLRFKKSPGAEVVAVVHDLIPLSDPTMNLHWRRIFKNKLMATIESADSFAFVSEFTRKWFADFFPQVVEQKRWTVLYPSVADDFADLAESAAGASSNTVGEGERRRGYLVVIASSDLRKNLDNLVIAFERLPPEIGLKIVGDVKLHGFPATKVGERSTGEVGSSRIELLGYIDEESKKSVIANSLGVIVPSFSEGFGIPLVEGCFFGKPVFCSDIPVFREVMGENAFYFDPYSPKSIAAAVNTYLEKPAAYRGRVAAARVEGYKRFSVTALVDAVGRRFGHRNPNA